MAVFNKNGVQINNVYDGNGDSIQQCYDKYGNPLLGENGGTTLTVMQYNVGQWYTGSGQRMPDSRYDVYSEMHREIIKSNNPSIVAFEEYVDPVISDISVIDMIGDLLPNRITGGGSETYQRKAIYTRDLELSQPVTQRLTWGYLVRTTAQIGGKTLNLICTHWSNTAEQRAAESATVFELSETLDNVIIFGDINTTCYSVEDQDYIDVMERWVDAGYHCSNCSNEFGFYNTWFAGHNFETVDYESRGAPNDCIITSPNIRINEVYLDRHKIPVCEALGLRLDHAPMVASVTVF